MKNIIINKNSWHYWFATTFSNINYRYPNHPNICSYMRKVLAGMTIATLLSFLALCVVIIFVCGVITLTASSFGYVCTLPKLIQVIGVVVVMLISMAFLMMSANILVDKIQDLLVYSQNPILKRWRERRQLNQHGVPTILYESFITHAYRSWRNKMCVKIKFVDQSSNEQ